MTDSKTTGRKRVRPVKPTRYRLIIPAQGEKDGGDIIAEIHFHKTPEDPQVMYDSAVLPDALPSSLFDTYTSQLNAIDPHLKRRVRECYWLIHGNRKHVGDQVVAEFTCAPNHKNRLQVEHVLLPGTDSPEERGTLTALQLIGTTYRNHERQQETEQE